MTPVVLADVIYLFCISCWCSISTWLADSHTSSQCCSALVDGRTKFKAEIVDLSCCFYSSFRDLILQ